MKMAKSERIQLLNLFGNLRVADVRDGMDTLLLHHVGSMSPDIRPLFRTRICGIARTVRYLPYTGGIPDLKPDQYWKWVGQYYAKVCTYTWMDAIEPGDICIIDQSGVDAGLMGSNNSLGGLRKGAVGYVSNGGVRDTDELVIQKTPFWSPFISQKMVQCRLKFDSMQVPVSVGGVTVYPGDVVVADGDGVIVVPRAKARMVAKYAAAEHGRDKAGRREHYEKLGIELDETVLDTESR